MRTRKVLWLVLALVLLGLVCVQGAAALDTKRMKVYVHVYEQNGGSPVPASGVSVNLYVPEAGGVVIASGTTDSNGYKLLEGTVYVGDSVGVWMRRSTPGGAFNLTIPTRFLGYRTSTGTNRWLLWVTYNHVTGSCSYWWTALPPDR